MATLYPPVLEAKAQAIPYTEVAGLDNYYNIEFKMPDVNPIEDIGHIQVSIKYQSTNEAAVNRDRSPDGNVLYFNREESHNYFHRKDSGNYEISIPYFCFDGGRPQQGTTYCVQVRFGNDVLWTTGSGISDRDFGGFAAWRARSTSAIPSWFGEWSNVQTVYCYGSAAVSLTANYNDFIPELEYRYAPVLDDPLEQIKIVYEYADLYGSTFNTLVFNGQRQQDGVYTLKVKLPIAPVQRILVSLEAITKNNTIRGRTLTIVPLKYSKVFPVLKSEDPDTGERIPLIEEAKLYGEENEDGCLAKTVSIPELPKKPDGTVIPDDPEVYQEGSTLSIYRANIYSLETIKVIEGLDAARGAKTTFRDYSVEMGEEYQYIAVLKDADGIAYALVEDIYDWGYDNPGYGRLMHMDSVFLTTRNHQLRLQGNVNITAFKRNTQDQFQTTLGSQFPFYQRSAKTNYRTFTLSGLVTANHDPTGSFLRNDNENGLWWDDDNGSRLVILNKDLYSIKQFSISRARMRDFLQKNDKLAALDEVNRDEIFETEDFDQDYYGGQFGPMTVFDDYLHRNIIRSGSTEKTDENIYFERKFRDFVMLWLADGKPKLFRSETEGNMIVMISGASFTPQDKSNRMVYNLSCTVTEIAEYNLENLINYNLMPFVFQTQLITGLPRNLTFGSVVDKQDYLAIIGFDRTLEPYFTLDQSTGTYIVNNNADLGKLNDVINQVNEYTYVRGDLDPAVYDGLIYQYNKIYNIPDSLAGTPIKSIQTIAAVKGGSGDYNFSVVSPTYLPSGLTLNPDTGEISGIPVSTSSDPIPSHQVTLQVYDNVTKEFAQMTITAGIIYPQLTFKEIGVSIAEEKVGTNITPINLSSYVSGGLKFSYTETGSDFDYIWSTENLPKGFTINNYGVITGAYTEVVEPGEAVIQVVDAAGQVATQTLQFGQGYFPIYFYPSINFNVGYSEQGVPIKEVDVSSGVSGGKQNITPEYPHGYKFSAEGLPAGITIDPGTGIISGSPLNQGNAVTATITATDFDAPTPSSASITILVQAQLEKFEFLDVTHRLDIDPGGDDPSGGAGALAPMQIGTVIDPIQVYVQGDPNKDNPDEVITYDMAEVRGGLRYVDRPYYRFSAEYLLPDFTIDNYGKISGRAQVASEQRVGILKVFDARGEMRYVNINIAPISAQLTFDPSEDYRLFDTFVYSNNGNYYVRIPLSDIKNGKAPFKFTFRDLPSGIEGRIEQNPDTLEEYIEIGPPDGATQWPTAPMSAGYITIEVEDTPANAEDLPEKIQIKIPRGVIVPELKWNQQITTLPSLSDGQQKKVYFSGVTGGIYPYTVTVISGDLSPWIIRQTEGAEQDPNMFYFEGTGNGATAGGSVEVQITDASGQSKRVVFDKGETFDKLTFSLKNSFGNYDLLAGISQVPGKKSSIPVISGNGGQPPYTYEVITSSVNEIVPGLRIDSSAGTISGIPTEIANPADMTARFRIKDNTGSYGSWDGVEQWFSPMVTNIVEPADGITSPYAERNLKIQEWYSKRFFKTNSNRKIIYTMTGTLPTGLSFNNGVISGTVTAIGEEKRVVLTATVPADDFNPTDQVTTIEVIFPAIAGYLNYVVVPANLRLVLQQGVAMPQTSVSDGLSGGVAPYTWSISGGPAGVRIEWDTLDTSKAYLVGTPTELGSSGSITVTVTDGAKQTASISFNWVVYEPLIFPDSPALDIPPQQAWTEIEAIDIPKTVQITGGSGDFVFSADANISPYFCSASGLIYGNSQSKSQPARNCVITVEDRVTGLTAQVTINVGEITGAMSYDGNPSIPAGTINTAIPQIDLKKDITGGGTPIFTLISVPNGWLPNSVKVDSSTGIVTGTRPATNAMAGEVVVSVADSASPTTQITIRIPAGAVSGEALTYTPDATARAIPDGRVNTGGTVNIKSGFTGLAAPAFTITSMPAGWRANSITISTDAVITYSRPAAACAASELKIRVTDSGQTIDITIPVGVVS